MPLSLYVVIGVHTLAPKAMQVQPKLVLNILTRQSVYSD